MEQNQNNVQTNTQVTEIDLIEVARVFLRKWWLIVIAAVIGAIFAGVYTKFFVTPMYQSQAMLYILPNTTSITSVADLQIGMEITGDFVIIAKSKPTVDSAINAIALEEGIQFTRGEVLGMISVANDEDTRILRIRATSANPEHASIVANAMAEATAERMAVITKKDPPTTVEQAEPALGPISPSMSKNVVLGFAIGAFLVCAVLLIQYLMNDHIKTEEDIEKYLGEATLVSIPFIKNRGNKAEELKAQKGEKRE